MKSIIVATDFSPAATNAAFYAADMADAINADLFLLHVFTIPVTYGDVSIPINIDEWEKDATDELAKLKEQILLLAPNPINIRFEVRVGNFMPELETLCAGLKPYAVVIGSTGKTAAERLLFGSHAIEAMQQLAWPLIAVPAAARFTAIANIGLACDLQDVIHTVPVEEIRQLVTEFNAGLHILHISKEKAFDPEAVFASGLLQDKLVELDPQFHFISGNDVDQGIVSFAEANKIDLLIVLPKRHTLLEKMTHKSHSKQFVLHSHVPLLALHTHSHT